ncbi:Beta-glucuronidase, partial [Pseudocercospora fuligena]
HKLLTFLACAIPVWPYYTQKIISIPEHAPPDAGVPLDSFVSFSIEFSYFPDFAGNLSHPNTFSNNLLENIAKHSGSKPLVRVGGSSQDNAIFDASQEQAVILNFASPTDDQPANLTFGPKYFESYHTWPKTSFIHGFNLKANTSENHAALLESAKYACHSLGDQLYAWELGNEPDLYHVLAARPTSYDEIAYVAEWHNLTRAIESTVEAACPNLEVNERAGWYAPSFAAAPALSTLDQVVAWDEGLNSDESLKEYAAHHYQAVATDPGITLRGTLMNHTATIASVDYLLNISSLVHGSTAHPYPRDLPFILGEGNSLARQGRPGLSNTFGAALWGVDANLLLASHNVSRFHMHQGTNYRYQSWQPFETNRATKGTKPPYYGNIAVAAFLGDLTKSADRPQVINLPQSSETRAAYAAYVHGKLRKIMLLNLQDYNSTAENEYMDSSQPRGSQSFELQLPRSISGRSVKLQRLIANGSDAISGVTFDGYSFNYELDNGKPVLLPNVTRGEARMVSRWGLLNVEVLDSSAVLVSI